MSEFTEVAIKETVRDIDSDIYELFRKAKALDNVILRRHMRGKSIDEERQKMADCLQRIAKLKALRKRTSALLG